MNNEKALATIPQNNSGELAQLATMSVAAVVERKKKIGEVMEAVMRDGEHYGVIPGCGDKPSLYKAGAEILATTFGLAPTFKITRTDMANGHREYEVVCTLSHIATGAVLGEGVGACSTMESKYRWRNASRRCPSCGKDAIIKGKAEYGGGWLCFARKGGCGEKWSDGAKEIEDQEAGRVENPDIADTYNTVLKMAKKRAQVDCTLTAVGASDLLTQDLEDLQGANDNAQPERASRTQSSRPQTNEPRPEPLTDDEVEDLVEQLSRCGTEKALLDLAGRTKPRVDVCDKAVIERLQRVFTEQRKQIIQADAADRDASKTANRGNRGAARKAS